MKPPERDRFVRAFSPNLTCSSSGGVTGQSGCWEKIPPRRGPRRPGRDARVTCRVWTESALSARDARVHPRRDATHTRGVPVRVRAQAGGHLHRAQQVRRHAGSVPVHVRRVARNPLLPRVGTVASSSTTSTELDNAKHICRSNECTTVQMFWCGKLGGLEDDTRNGPGNTFGNW